MGGSPLKPSHLRQRTNKKAGHANLTTPQDPVIPPIPNPDGREWHPLTMTWWNRVWVSPMAAQYIDTDIDGLGRVALLVDQYYRKPQSYVLGEIRLQEMRFGLSPLDRSRLQWEITKAEEAEKKRAPAPTDNRTRDPRKVLKVV